MKKIRLLALLILGFVATTAMAQTIRVSGVVTSAEDGQPLPGVTVLVKGTNNGTGSSADGRYSLDKVPSNGTLEFRYVGMQTQSIAVGGKTTINAVMRVDALQATEVTVTALGVRKENRALGYATTTVKGEELARTNQVSPINALQGKVAGVQIQSIGSAGVTSSPSIVIRGGKSLTKNNSPIFVIDGIVMQNEEAKIGALGASDAGQLYGNQLKNLNPDDFETMTVLKGAAATSLYGSRGANGAVVITTKSGKVRKGLGIQASYTHEWQQVYQAPYRLQNLYGMGDPTNGFEGDYQDAWKSTYSEYGTSSFGPRMDGQLMQQYYKGPGSVPEPFVAQPDNWKALFQTGQYDNASIAITGGTNDVTYRLSYAYTKSQGTLVNNSFNRHSINFNTTGKINDIMTIDASVQYSNSNALNPQKSNAQTWQWSYAMATGYYINRNTDLQWVADNYIDPETYDRRSLPLDNNVLGFFNQAIDNNLTHNEQTIIARVGLNLQLTKWLDASANVSFNDYKYFDETKNYGSGQNRAGGEYAVGYGSSGQFNGLAQIHYGDKFLDDRLEVDVRVLGEIYGNTRSFSSHKRTNGLITPGLFTFSNSKNEIKGEYIGVGYSPRSNMTIGLAAIASLGWDNQVYLEVTARNDWVSSLLYPTWLPQGANNYSVFYPSVNASWIFSETFKIDPSILSLGKIRASWAQVGMGTGAYETAKGAGGYSQGGTSGPAGENSVIYANPNNGTLPNYDLKPEIQQSIEFGADVRFLDDRIGVDVTYYKTNTFNQILTLGAAPESGVGTRLINAGNIQNQGWELQLDFNPIRTREVNWNISINWSRNRGKIIEFHDEIKQLRLMDSNDQSPAIYAFEGGAFGQIVGGNGYGGAGEIAKQRDPNKAHYGKDIIYYNGKSGDPNGVEVFRYRKSGDVSEYYNNTDNKYSTFGNVQPDFYFGFNTSLSYKGFDLFVQIDGRKGGHVITPLLRYQTGTGTLETTLQGRDADHGGLARKNYKGETVYNGMIMDGVFNEKGSEVTSLKTGEKVSLNGMTMQEAVDAGHIQPMNSNLYYMYNYNWTSPGEYFTQELTYVALREVTIGYNFPEKWIKHIGMQSARLSFSARNICYIYNGLEGKSNPEALTSNNPLTPFDASGLPFARNFALSLNVRF